MEQIRKLADNLQESLNTIFEEISIAEEKTYVYARARNIRKAAQELKVTAQELRKVASDEIKKVK